jgi:hypothetical protein
VVRADGKLHLIAGFRSIGRVESIVAGRFVRAGRLQPHRAPVGFGGRSRRMNHY